MQGLPIQVELTMEAKRKVREATIHFVMPDGTRQDSMSSFMRLAHDSIRTSTRNIDLNFIRFVRSTTLLKSLKNCPEEVTGIFIIEDLKGEIFQRLLKRSQEDNLCRIFGPVAVAQSFGWNLLLPLTKGVPLVNLGLRNLVVGVSESVSHRINEFKNKLLPLGVALVTKKLLKTINVVISENVTDLMSVAARTYEIPIVDPKWVQYCYEKKDEPEFSVRESAQSKVAHSPHVRDNRIRVFKGMVFCSSQVPPDYKEKLMKIAEKLGFTYEGCLVKDRVTHLICDKPEGDKYLHARKWDIKTVSRHWVQDSVVKGDALIEKGRYVTGGDDDLAEVEFEFENEVPATQVPSLATQTIGRRETARFSTQTFDVVDQVFDKSLTQTRKSGCSQETEMLSMNDRDMDMQDEENLDSFRQYEQKGNQVPTLMSRLEDLLLDIRDNSLLDGCTVFICNRGFNEKARRLIKRLVNKSQGLISNDITDSNVTHCIVPSRERTEDTQKLLQQIQIDGSSAMVVDVDWLLQSLEMNTLLPDCQFDIYASTPYSPNKSSAEIPNTLLGFQVIKKKIPIVRRPAQPDLEEVLEDKNPEEEDLFNQYSVGSTQTRIKNSSQQTSQRRETVQNEAADVFVDDTSLSTQVNLFGQVKKIWSSQRQTPTQGMLDEEEQEITLAGIQGSQFVDLLGESSQYDVPMCVYDTVVPENLVADTAFERRERALEFIDPKKRRRFYRNDNDDEEDFSDPE
jgi:hypothetical protein